MVAGNAGFEDRARRVSWGVGWTRKEGKGRTDVGLVFPSEQPANGTAICWGGDGGGRSGSLVWTCVCWTVERLGQGTGHPSLQLGGWAWYECAADDVEMNETARATCAGREGGGAEARGPAAAGLLWEGGRCEVGGQRAECVGEVGAVNCAAGASTEAIDDLDWRRFLETVSIPYLEQKLDYSVPRRWWDEKGWQRVRKDPFVVDFCCK